tara:strand:- start:267 stop:644 length:378 start_codon:yes stop_codon:yes gene_type:complete
MITSINKVLIMGRVESDPDFRVVGENNSDKLGFRVRTERGWKNAKTGDDKTFSTVHRIVAWGIIAKNNKDMKAGAQVMVDGRLDNRKYQDNEGNDKWISEINANDIQVYGGGAEAPAPSEDEIPF